MLVNWLLSLDPSLLHHLQSEGIAPELVEEKAREHCYTSLAYRHRLVSADVIHTSWPRFRIRIDAKSS